MNQEVGFVGLGNMGYHMVSHILENNIKVFAYDINPEVYETLQHLNIVKCNSPKEVADRAETIFISLPTPKIVKQVALGENGLIEGHKIKRYVDLSSTGYEVAKEIAENLNSKSIEVLDAPVSGGVPGAKSATLAIMVSGKKELFDSISIYLKYLGTNIFHVGEDIGQAQVMKVLNNLLSSTALAVTAEAVVLGVKAGLDPDRMIDVFNASSGKNSATEKKFKQYILNREFEYGFKTALVYKDLKLCMDLADSFKMPMFIGSNVENFWKFVLNQGEIDQDSTEVVKCLENFGDVIVKSIIKEDAI